MNNVMLIGRITRDLELRTNEAGTSKCQFSIAVPRRGAKEGTQDVDFINVVAWNKLAENLAKYMDKGSLIGIEGSLRADNYTDRDGNNRTFNYVLAENIQYLSGFKGEEKKENKDELDLPFKLDDVELSESDLPF
jgi:single-strand DNA-binding protein